MPGRDESGRDRQKACQSISGKKSEWKYVEKDVYPLYRTYARVTGLTSGFRR